MVTDDFATGDTVMFSESVAEPEGRADPSYDLCLAGWAKWLVDTGCGAASEDEVEVREAVVVQLVSTLGPVRAESNAQASKT